MTTFYYLPPEGKNKVWQTTFCDGKKEKWFVKDGEVLRYTSFLKEEHHKLYCQMYPQYK